MQVIVLLMYEITVSGSIFNLTNFVISSAVRLFGSVFVIPNRFKRLSCIFAYPRNANKTSAYRIYLTNPKLIC